MPIQLKSSRASFIVNFVVDFVLLFASFIIIYAIKRGHIFIETQFLNFLPALVISWFFATFLSRKFKLKESGSIISSLKPYIVSILIQIGLLSILLYGFKWFELSRFIIFGSIFLFFLMELGLLSGSHIFPFVFNKEKKKQSHFSLYFFIAEFLLITSTFLGIYFYKRGNLNLTDDYKAIFVIIYFTWIFIGITVHKFCIKGNINYLKTIWPFIKASIIQLATISFFVFAFQILEFSRLVLFGSILLFSTFEFIFVTIYYLYKKPQESDEIKIDLFSASILKEPEVSEIPKESERLHQGKYKISDLKIESHGFAKKLKNVYLKDAPEVFKFLNDTIDLNSVDMMTSEIIHSANQYNVDVLPKESMDFFFNLRQVNDIRRINSYFISVNEKLKWNGIYVGRFESFSKRRQRIFRKYPYYLASVVYVFDFIWKRIFPKLPFFQKIYFAISKGKNRVFSKAEALGRLYFCGFEIIALEEIDNLIYFVVKKAKEPLKEANPSYGPLFKMKRTGKNDRPIYVYKLRTMHPYSEYLQEYITSRNGYAENGKVFNDFRATAWGKFLRKYWLDEAPQLINVIKGEMKLIGARPLSNRVYKEYPEDIKKLRSKYKPGCFPPYVSLLMQNMNASIEAERIYLNDKQRHPILTDIKYFYLAVSNILSNKIRSA